MEKDKKVLVIGLDGATFDLLEPWVEQGKLPTLAGLMKKGARGNLMSTLQSNSAQAWSSFVTGINAGRHGIYDFIRPIPKSYEVQFTNAGLREGTSLWKTISDHDMRVGVVNVPMTYPPEAVNGFMIAGVDSPGIHSGFVSPPEIFDEIENHVGNYILEAGVTGLIRRGRPDLALEGMYNTIDIRLKAAKYFLTNKPWNFFMVVFTEPDRVQHFYWKYIDRNHPNHHIEEVDKYGDAIFSIYDKLDKAVSELLELVPEDTTVFVMSDHGGGASTHKTFYINKWLCSTGYLTYGSKSGAKDVLGGLKKKIMRQTSFFLSARIPRNVKERLVRFFPKLHQRVGSATMLENIDWSKTKVYSRENAATISINLKGREPRGIVQLEEYESLIAEISNTLMAVKCPDTGKPIVGKVWRKEEIYSGPYIDLAPDLLLEWNDYAYIQRPSFLDEEGGFIKVLRGKELEKAERISRPSGIHRPNGILIGVGDGIKKGEKIQDARLMDLHPTVLHALGLPVPGQVEGIVIEALFEPHFLANNPVRKDDTSKVAEHISKETIAYSDTESDIIRERLSGLGYID